MAQTEALTGYQRRLLLFLSVATLFEGYDFLAITQILPNLRSEWGLGKAWAGYLIAFINVGTLLSSVVVRVADRIGRRRLLTITIAGYTLLTFATGLSPNVYAFGFLQLGARIFLIAEWAVAMVIAAEEFPAARRGLLIGVIQGFASLGSIICAGLTPLLLRSAYGWRAVYFVSIVPLALIAYARKDLRETRRFTDVDRRTEGSFFAIWKSPYRGRMLTMALIWFTSYIAAQNIVSFWKEFAIGERGLSDADVGRAITIAAIFSLPLVLLAGRLIDLIGRRRGAVVVFTVSALGVFGSYTLHGQAPLTAALVLGIFAASAYLPLLNAFTSELFPTELRANAFAWANNLLGRSSFVGAPLVVGLVADRIGAFGPAVATTALFPFVSIALILRFVPETAGRELEETSALS